jgi:membrane fusion protein, heavy metal efflux system
MDTSNQSNPAPKGRRLAATVIFVAALAAAFLAGLMWRDTRSAAEPHHEAQAGQKSQSGDTAKVTLDTASQRNIGLQLAPAEARTLQQTILATGSVGADDTRLAHIRSIARGRIDTIQVRLGDRVRAGQPLLAYDNIELGDAIGRYLSALATLGKTKSEAEVAKRSAERARSLVSLGAVAQAEYDRRAAEYQDALATVESQRAEAASTEQKLHRFGMTDPEIGELKPSADSQYHREASHTTLVAPFPGIVTSSRVSPGESIGPEDELMTVADLSTVWVQANVYEKDIPVVRQGIDATVSVEAYPGRVFAGRITYISDFLDPKTRTAKVRCEVHNPDGLLKLDMFASIQIPVPAGRAGVLIPAAAVQHVNDRPVVFVRTSATEFELRNVELGAQSDGWIEVTNGVKAGEAVAAHGSFFLKSTLLRSQIGSEE